MMLVESGAKKCQPEILSCLFLLIFMVGQSKTFDLGWFDKLMKLPALPVGWLVGWYDLV